MANGLHYDSGDLLVNPVDEEEFATHVEHTLLENEDQIRSATRRTAIAAGIKRELPVEKLPDPADPTAVGWTYVVRDGDPALPQIIEALAKLAKLRHMTDPKSPLRYDGTDGGRWIRNNYGGLPVSERPRYVLLIGGPQAFPFHFQSLFGVSAFVGRLDLPPEGLAAYVRKLIRRSEAGLRTEREVLFFAPDYGKSGLGEYDPTYFSCHFMAQPLAQRVREKGVYQSREILADQATKERLREALREGKSALVYTASHGMGRPGADLESQKQIHGAICCQRSRTPRPGHGYLYSARDVPDDPDEPVAEGAVFFQFACYGYGTPASSDFAHWYPKVPSVNSTEDFVSALPQKLIAHPRGPVAYVGHVDLAWLHGFDDPAAPIKPRWDARLTAFHTAVTRILGQLPVSLALTDLSERYNQMNASLTQVLDDQQRGTYDPSPEERARLADNFILRSDGQNYMVYGDPAAAVRVE